MGLNGQHNHNSVQNIAHHSNIFFHTCLKWIEDVFYGGGCLYFDHLIQYYWLGNGNFESIRSVLGHHYEAVATSQEHGDTPDPSESFPCVSE